MRGRVRGDPLREHVDVVAPDEIGRVVDDCRTNLAACRISVTGPWLPYAFGEAAA